MDAIIYAAKSSADVRESIPTQLSDARALCKSEGLTVIDEYSEESKSAFSGNRGERLELARAHAEQIAAEKGACALVVQHTDRLARGDGVKAQHLVEVVLWANKSGVTIRSVQDDRSGESVLDAALTGQRNNEDSERKSKAVKAGLRRAVERGEWRGGIVPGGYAVEREIGASGKVSRRIVKHPEDEPIYELLWKLATEGKSVQAISLELGRRGYVTRPLRKNHKPKTFDTSRVIQVLNCPAYAGLASWQGEVFPADWPTYVDVETFYKLKVEREKRCSHTKRKRGRPPEGYLLASLAICGTCGESMHAQTNRHRSGTIGKRYVCRAHHERHRDDVRWCPAPRLDAAAVDRLVFGGIEHLLGDADALREQLRSGQSAERDKLTKVAHDAAEAVKSAERAADRATAEFADAEDDDERALLKDAAKAKRAEATRERARADAALDALGQLDGADDDPAASAALLWEALGADLSEAKGDIKAMNAVLRETFESVKIGLADDGRIIVKPRLLPDARAKHADPSGVVRIVEADHAWMAAPQGGGDEGSVILVSAAP